MNEIVYKIRNSSGLFSNGVIKYRSWDNKWSVRWTKHGKTWKTEKALKAHLLKALRTVSGVAAWEIVTMTITYHPTKPIDEWVDSNMLAEILKR